MRAPLLLLLLLTPLLGSCRYAYLPLIPPVLSVNVPPRIVSATLTRSGDELVVTAALGGTLKPDYLSVVWYNADTELGRDSVYLDAAQTSGTFRLSAPARGSYRALLSYGGVLLRQVELLETGEL